MKSVSAITVVLQICNLVLAEIESKGPLLNNLIKPVGSHIAHKFVALTEIPPPHVPHPGFPHPDSPALPEGRRHFNEDLSDCTKKEVGHEVHEGGVVNIFGDYYDDHVEKTVRTVIIPDHIDHKHFEVTPPTPYLTVGPVEAVGYHPSTKKSDYPPECEKIYQDHLEEQYSMESSDYSEESLEIARMPLFEPDARPPTSLEKRIGDMYDDFK